MTNALEFEKIDGITYLIVYLPEDLVKWHTARGNSLDYLFSTLNRHFRQYPTYFRYVSDKPFDKTVLSAYLIDISKNGAETLDLIRRNEFDPSQCLAFELSYQKAHYLGSKVEMGVIKRIIRHANETYLRPYHLKEGEMDTISVGEKTEGVKHE